MKTFDDYQQFTKSKAVYNESVWLHHTHRETNPADIVVMNYMYPLLALGEEAGEVQGKVAKFIRKSKNEVNIPQLREDVKKELGDLLYQVSECARQFGFTLQEVIDSNVAKLDDRQARGVLIGEGDNR